MANISYPWQHKFSNISPTLNQFPIFLWRQQNFPVILEIPPVILEIPEKWWPWKPAQSRPLEQNTRQLTKLMILGRHSATPCTTLERWPRQLPSIVESRLLYRQVFLWLTRPRLFCRCPHLWAFSSTNNASAACNEATFAFDSITALRNAQATFQNITRTVGLHTNMHKKCISFKGKR